MAKNIFDEKPLVDRLKLYFKKFFMSFNPDSYHQLTELTYQQGFRYLVRTVLLSSFILAILIILNLNSIRLGLNDELTKVQSCEISGNLTEPIIFEKQKIAIANQKNYTGENFLVSGSELVRRPYICNVIRPLCILSDDPIKTDLSVIKSNPELLGNFIFIILVLMLPSILFIYLFFYFIKSLLIITVLSLIAFAIIKVAKRKVSYRRMFLAAIFSSTVYLILEPFDISVWNLFYMHFIAYILLYTVVLVLLAEKKHRYDNL